MKNKTLKEYFQNKEVISVLGLSKNAGKTTFLNWFLENIGSESVGIFSTGRDGEEYDLVGGHEKPKVLIPTGSFYVTFAEEAQRQSPFVNIIAKTKFKAGGKELWILKALADLEAEIVGPASVGEQEQLTKQLQDIGCKQVLIDGALDRKSIALSSLVDDNILAASATFGSCEEILEELKKNISLSNIPTTDMKVNSRNVILYKNEDTFDTEFASILGNEKKLIEVIEDNEVDKIFIPGALTENSFKLLKQTFQHKIKTIIFPHPLHIQLKLNLLNTLIKYSDVLSQKSFPIETIAVNSFSVSGNHINCADLRDAVRTQFPDLTIIDVAEIQK
jgi:hypothetical protein